MRVRGYIRRNPVLVYYVLTFILSWVSIFAIVGPHGFPLDSDQLSKMLPLLMVAMLLGPVVVSLSLTGAVDGRPGYRNLLSRLFRWRVGIESYGAAVLIAPLLFMTAPLAFSIWSPEFLPRIFTETDKRSLLQLGLAAGAAAGVFEELGWTGFAIPRLRLRFGVLGTGAIAGFFWGAWHIPIIALQSGTLGATIFSFGLLPAFRVVMVWVYDRSRSLLLAMIMHMSLTASSLIFGLASAQGMTTPIFTLAISVTLWMVIGASFVASRRQARVHPLPD